MLARSILLVLILSSPALAQPAPEKKDEIATLIQQLSADDFATREQATQRLIDLGEPALPRLQQLLPITTDGETRNRIQFAVDQINELQTAGQTLLTLDVKDADAKEVFAEISRQCRATVSVPPNILPTLPKLTFKVDHEPFWPALRRLCLPLGLQPDTLSAGLVPNPMIRRAPGLPTDHAVNLIKGTNAWERTPTAFSGPFMICVQQITETGIVMPGLDQRAHNLVVQCTVLAEPKLTVVGRSSTARVTDPDPNANPPQNVPGAINNAFINQRIPFAGRAYYNPTGASAWPLLIPLARPKGATDTLPHLKAIANAKVLVRSDTWELPDILHAAPRSHTVAGRTFTVKSVNRQGDLLEVVATATRRTDRAGVAGDADDMATFASLELLDTENRPLANRTRSQRGTEDPTVIAYSILFETTADGAPIAPNTTPLRLRWRLPLDTKDLEIPVEFENLPLP